jgi:putative ABC transport system permease protein
MIRLCCALYRMCIALFPEDVRRRDGAEMLRLFEDLVGGARRERGRWVALVSVLRICAQVPRDAWSAHRRDADPDGASVLPRLSTRWISVARLTDMVGFDLRVASRGLSRSPRFTILAVITLALGIGATTFTFSLLYATLFRPLPFPEPDRLVALSLTDEALGGDARIVRWSYPEFEALRETARDLKGVAAFSRTEFNLSLGSEPVHVPGEVVSASYLEVLGVEAAVGRVFSSEEDRVPGSHPVVMLSHDLWTGRLGRERDILGSTVRVNGVPLVVIGVLPAGFRGLTGRADVWVTQAMAPQVTYTGQLTTPQHFLNVVGRLRDDATLAEAGVALAALAPVLLERFGDDHEAGSAWRARLTPLDAAKVDPSSRRSRLILFGAVLVVLLITAANMAGLFISRGLSRRREAAIRRALGSSRWGLIRQVLAESTLLGLLGGIGGVALSFALTEVLSIVSPGQMGRGPDAFGRQISEFAYVATDGWVVVFAVAVSLVLGVGFGLGPALSAARRGAELNARSCGPDDPTGRRRSGWLSGSFATLVVTEFAMALTLLVAAGLLIETLINLTSRDPGFDPSGLVTFRLQPPQAQYPTEVGPPLLEEVLERVSAVPGVISASVGPCAPLTGGCAWREIRSLSEAPGGGWVSSRRHYVGPDHFETLGIPLLAGRALSTGDRPGSRNVVVVNQSAAEVLWPGRDPLGRIVVFGAGNFIGGDSTALVVGVVGDVLYGEPDEPVGLDVYTSYLQFSRPFTRVVVRVAGSPTALVSSFRRAVMEVDSDLPIYDVRAVEDPLLGATTEWRFDAVLFASFSGLALLLAAIGIYGVMAQFVSARTREIGVRMAVGAGRNDVVRLVVERGLVLSLTGVAIGTAGALVATRLLDSQLYEVSPTDPFTFIGAAVILVLVGMLSVYAPAARATRVDPVTVLRGD